MLKQREGTHHAAPGKEFGPRIPKAARRLASPAQSEQDGGGVAQMKSLVRGPLLSWKLLDPRPPSPMYPGERITCPAFSF